MDANGTSILGPNSTASVETIIGSFRSEASSSDRAARGENYSWQSDLVIEYHIDDANHEICSRWRKFRAHLTDDRILTLTYEKAVRYKQGRIGITIRMYSANGTNIGSVYITTGINYCNNFIFTEESVSQLDDDGTYAVWDVAYLSMEWGRTSVMGCDD